MDVRIINTKHRIQMGLITVIGEKPLYKIKDKDIINKAEVSAASYYKYYRDKSAVLADIENELINDFRQALYTDGKSWLSLKYGPNKKEISKRINTNVSNILNFASDNKEYIVALISKNGDPALRFKMLELTAQIIKKLLIRSFQIYGQKGRLAGKDLEVEVITESYAHALLYPIFFWLTHSDKMSTSDAKKMIEFMMLRSPYDLSTHHISNS